MRDGRQHENRNRGTAGCCGGPGPGRPETELPPLLAEKRAAPGCGSPGAATPPPPPSSPGAAPLAPREPDLRGIRDMRCHKWLAKKNLAAARCGRGSPPDLGAGSRCRRSTGDGAADPDEGQPQPGQHRGGDQPGEDRHRGNEPRWAPQPRLALLNRGTPSDLCHRTAPCTLRSCGGVQRMGPGGVDRRRTSGDRTPEREQLPPGRPTGAHVRGTRSPPGPGDWKGAGLRRAGQGLQP